MLIIVLIVFFVCIYGLCIRIEKTEDKIRVLEIDILRIQQEKNKKLDKKE